MSVLRQAKSRIAGQLTGFVNFLPRQRRILLKPYLAIYIPIPKVACTSLKTAFAEILGLRPESAGEDPHREHYPSPVRIEALQGVLYPGFFTFGFVRNPWDRLVSCYRDKLANEVGGTTRFTIRPGVADCLAPFDAFEAGMSFDAFVAAVTSIPDTQADAHFRSQYTFLVNRKGDIIADFVGRYERLSDDFRIVREKTGLPDVELPRRQAAGEVAEYEAYYTPETRDLVGKRFQTDIETFGYEFGG